MTSASSMHEAGHLKPVLWNNLEGWGGVPNAGVGVGVGTGICVANSCRCMSKAITML